MQRRWGSSFDLGRGSLHFVRHLVLGSDRLAFPMAQLLVAAAVLLYAPLPAFPLLLPLARALMRTARARPWHAAW